VHWYQKRKENLLVLLVVNGLGKGTVAQCSPDLGCIGSIQFLVSSCLQIKNKYYTRY